MNNWNLKLVILQSVAKLKNCGLFVFFWLPFLIKTRAFFSLSKLSEMIDFQLKWRNFQSIDDSVEFDDFSFSVWLNKLHEIRQETCIKSWFRIGMSSFFIQIIHLMNVYNEQSNSTYLYAYDFNGMEKKRRTTPNWAMVASNISKRKIVEIIPCSKTMNY